MHGEWAGMGMQAWAWVTWVDPCRGETPNTAAKGIGSTVETSHECLGGYLAPNPNEQGERVGWPRSRVLVRAHLAPD